MEATEFIMNYIISPLMVDERLECELKKLSCILQMYRAYLVFLTSTNLIQKIKSLSQFH